MKKNVIALFLVSLLAFTLVGCGGGSGSGNPDNTANKYAGSWQGTLTIQESGDSVSASITISNSGVMTGTLTNSAGESSVNFSGQLTGSSVTFTYQYSGGPQITGSGVFGEIINNQMEITFTLAYSGNTAHGTGSLTRQGGTSGGSGTLTITTIAGNGTQGYSGDGGIATSAELNDPRDVAVDNSGSAYIADTLNYRIRKVSTSGIITTIAGNGTYGYSGDNGAATSAKITYANGIAVDAYGNLYIADVANYRVRKVNTAGIITTVAGTGTAGYSGDGGPAINAAIQPDDIVVDASGNIYIADGLNNRIRKVNTSGIITTIAGTGVQGYSGDGGPATNAQLYWANDLAMDTYGNLYIADIGNYRIRKVDTSGKISTIAGNGICGFSGDGGLATSAGIEPGEIAVDSSGNIYIADTGNRIRKVNTSGVITTIAGTGNMGYSGDGGPATNAEFFILGGGIAVDASGKVYITDRGNKRIRKLQ